MKCPSCGSDESKMHRCPADFIADVHAAMGELKRQRECLKCGERWHTIELPLFELQRLRGLACMARLEEL